VGCLTLRHAQETYVVSRGPFSVGREGNLTIGDNPYLHRRFLEFREDGALWWLSNVGTALSASLHDPSTGAHAKLPPGVRMPIVFATTLVRFTAGTTDHEIAVELEGPAYSDSLGANPSAAAGAVTIGRIPLSLEQHIALLVLAEGTLRGKSSEHSEIQTASESARRLGWTQKKFEKKLDNLCDRLSAQGVAGLKGQVGNHAQSRRARLVDYALSTGLVTVADLDLLDQIGVPATDD